MVNPFEFRYLSAIICGLFALVYTSSLLVATENTQDILQQMTEESIGRRADQKTIERANDLLGRLVETNPSGLVSAAVFVNRGATADEARTIVNTHDLEIMGLLLKVPRRKRTDILTISVGPVPEIITCGHSGVEQLSIDVAFEFAQIQIGWYSASGLGVSPDAKNEDPVIYDEDLLRIFRLDVIGTANALETLAGNPSILSVFVDQGNQRIESHRYLMELFGQVCQ